MSGRAGQGGEDELAVLAATLRELCRRAGAVAVSALLDRGEIAGPALVECAGATAPLRVTVEDETVELDPGERPAAPVPAIELDLRPVPPVAVDLEAGEIASLPGAVESVARAATALAGTLTGRSVVVVELETDRPDVPLTIAARAGEPLVLGLGDEQFPMPPGWPATAND